MAEPHSEEQVKAYRDKVRDAEQKLEGRIGTGAGIAPSEAQAARAEYQAAVDAARAELEKSGQKQPEQGTAVRRP